MFTFKKDGGDNNDLTVIASSTKMKGDLNSNGDIRVEGEIEGSVKTAQKVYIGKEAQLCGNISAKEAIIEGKVNADIKTDRLELSATARIIGNIETQILAMEAGAFFSGTFKVGTFQAPVEDIFTAGELKQDIK